VSNVLCNASVWAFTLAGDASTHQGTPLLDLLRLAYRVRCRTSIVMSGSFEPPPCREVGELSARPLGFYTVSLAKCCYSIALRYTENKGYSQSSILISPLIPRVDLVRRHTYIYIYSNACLEMSALLCRVPTLFVSILRTPLYCLKHFISVSILKMPVYCL
jgi:hypothetical protein